MSRPRLDSESQNTSQGPSDVRNRNRLLSPLALGGTGTGEEEQKMGLGQVGRDREGALGCGWRGHAETGGHSRDCPWLVTEAQVAPSPHGSWRFDLVNGAGAGSH